MGGYGPAIAQGMMQQADVIAEPKREINREHSDYLWHQKHDDLHNDIFRIRDSLYNLPKPEGNASKEEKDAYAAAHAQGVQDLTNAVQAYKDLLDPSKNPGFFDKIKHRLGLNEHPLTQVAPPRVASSEESGAPSTTIPGGSYTASMPAGERPTVVGPDGKPAATPAPQDTSVQVSEPSVSTGATPAYKGTPTVAAAPQPGQYSTGTVKQLRERADKLKEANDEVGRMLAGAPMSQSQQAVTAANAQNAGTEATIKAAMNTFDRLNPDASDDDRKAQMDELMQKYYAVSQTGNWTSVNGKMNGQPTTLLFDKKTHQYRSQSGDLVPREMLETFVPVVATSVSAKRAQDFQDFKATHPEYQGTQEQWEAEERAKGSAAGKPPNRDDKFIAIEEKKAKGEPLTDDDKAYDAAYNLYVQKTKIAPGVARAAAFAADRYVPVLDPSNPESVVLMHAGDAAKAGVGTPQSIGFQTDKAITRYMTSGAGGTNIAYFNTATDHLRLLRKAAAALQNGEYPTYNEWANKYATAVGYPEATQFETVKAAVSGELSKTFKGTGATDSEIAEINQTINQAQSPEQINGAINYYTDLMEGKINALKSQYEAGASGHPDFGGGTPTPHAVPHTPIHSGSVSVTAPDGSVHTFPNQAAADQFKKAANIP